MDSSSDISDQPLTGVIRPEAANDDFRKQTLGRAQTWDKRSSCKSVLFTAFLSSAPFSQIG
jgi:hypothetical protein